MARIRKALPRHMWPAEILLAQELPRTDTAKLDRSRLAEMDAQRRDQRSRSIKDDSAPSQWKDELPRRIAGLIASNLKLKVMGPQDNFIDLGGDSLEALSIAVNIEKTFGVTIDPSELLEAPTVGATIEKVATMARANR
jgi:acyl carrier protein